MRPPTVMENNKREICFFNLLFPETLSIEIATKTNEYTRKHIEATPNKNWYPTNPEEIKALIGFVIFSPCFLFKFYVIFTKFLEVSGT
jgi:hypothetical protein